MKNSGPFDVGVRYACRETEPQSVAKFSSVVRKRWGAPIRSSNTGLQAVATRRRGNWRHSERNFTAISLRYRSRFTVGKQRACSGGQAVCELSGDEKDSGMYGEVATVWQCSVTALACL